ncbi:MAG TPA: tripartite tricarboxylate transporter TctB family protein [Zeimonas sp.]
MSAPVRVSPYEFVAPVFFLAFSAAFLLVAYGYGEASREVPVAVGYAALVLAFVDLLTRLPTAFGRRLAQLVGSAPETAPADHANAGVPLAREAGAIVSLACFVASTLAVGMLITTPVYVYLYMVFWGGRARWHGLLGAVGATAFAYLVFELLLRYPLYRGTLFD